MGDADRKGNYLMYDFRIYDDENRMSYPYGFAVGNELTIIVTYSDGAPPKSSTSAPYPSRWVVAMPSGLHGRRRPITELREHHDRHRRGRHVEG